MALAKTGIDNVAKPKQRSVQNFGCCDLPIFKMNWISAASEYRTAIRYDTILNYILLEVPCFKSYLFAIKCKCPLYQKKTCRARTRERASAWKWAKINTYSKGSPNPVNIHTTNDINYVKFSIDSKEPALPDQISDFFNRYGFGISFYAWIDERL